MVAKKNNQGKPRKQNKRAQPVPKKTKAVGRRMATALDAAGIAYARMLNDPCNASLVAPSYSGMGTGEYRRFRTIFNIPVSSEGTYMFVPGANLFLAATHVPDNAGLPYTFNTNKLFYSDQLSGETESRCLAACVKVRFIGTEVNRKGTIALRTNPFCWATDQQEITNSDCMVGCPVINRIGEVQHEVKFVPGTADELFTGNYGGPVVANKALGAFGFTYSDVPVGSLQVEVTAIIEVEVQKNMIVSSVPATTRNTTNHVLSALGPTARWAYGHVVAPTLRAAAGAAMQTLSSGINSSSVGGLLLTL